MPGNWRRTSPMDSGSAACAVLEMTESLPSPSQNRKLGVLTVSDEHAARIVSDAEFRLHGRDDRLRRHPARPEDRQLVVAHFDRIAIVRLHHVFDPDQLRLADMHWRAVH